MIVSPDGVIMAARDPKPIGTDFENEKLMDILKGSKHQSGTISKESGLASPSQILSYCAVLGNSGYLIAPFDYYSGMNKVDINGYIQSVFLMILFTLLATVILAVILSGKLSASVGLYNVNRRIVHEYGKEYGVRVRSEISEYTVVTVTLPYTEK